MTETTQTKRSYKRLTEDEVKRAKAFLAEGITPKVVAENLGVKVQTIYRLSNGNGNGHTEKTKSQSSFKTPRVNSLVGRVQKQLDTLRTRQEYHQQKADWYNAQLEQLKEVFSSVK